MASKHIDTLRGSHEAYNRRDFDSILKTLSNDSVYADRPRGLTIKGKTQFREFLNGWAQGFSDGRITNPQYTDASDTVVAQFTFEGTNDGPYQGLKATGRRVSIPICEIVRYDANGQAVSSNLYYDQYSIMTQLGHLKPLSAAA